MEGNDTGVLFSPFVLTVIVFLSTTIMFTVYHCVLVRWFGHRNSLTLPHHHRFPTLEEGTSGGLENSFIQLIPAYKYGKEDGKCGEGGENVCSVCLCEFKEGEDVRRLPDCLHSFHAPCIDMWFYSHSNCPLCRAEMTPSPILPLRQPVSLPDSGPHVGG